VGAAGAAKVLVAVPTDFTLSESCQELMDALCGVRGRHPGPTARPLSDPRLHAARRAAERRPPLLSRRARAAAGPWWRLGGRSCMPARWGVAPASHLMHGHH
jgi:hypothetical protein